MWRRALAGETYTIQHEFCDARLIRNVYDISFAPLLDENGRPAGASQIGRDVTGRTLAAAEVHRLNADLETRLASHTLALEQSEQRFRATFEQAAAGLAHVGFDGRWLRMNQRLCDITGHSREALREKTFQDITHPEDYGVTVAMRPAAPNARW
jgi:transcriptional regulator with PAS, ATPase and Fis domain